MLLSIHLSIGAFLHCNFLSFFRLCYCQCIVSVFIALFSCTFVVWCLIKYQYQYQYPRNKNRIRFGSAIPGAPFRGAAIPGAAIPGSVRQWDVCLWSWCSSDTLLQTVSAVSATADDGTVDHRYRLKYTVDVVKSRHFIMKFQNILTTLTLPECKC